MTGGGRELAGFYSIYDEVAALDEGYYDEDTQTLMYPIVNSEPLYKNDPRPLNRLKKGMKNDINGVYYTNY